MTWWQLILWIELTGTMVTLAWLAAEQVTVIRRGRGPRITLGEVPGIIIIFALLWPLLLACAVSSWVDDN